MGFIRDAKTEKVGRDAGRAREEGRTVFVARANVSGIDAGTSGAVRDVAEMLEAIEAEGWTLADMSWTRDAKNKPEGYFLFRRVSG